MVQVANRSAIFLAFSRSTLTCFTHPPPQHEHRSPHRHTSQGKLGDIHHWLDRDSIWSYDDDGDWPSTGATPATYTASATRGWLCFSTRRLPLLLWWGRRCPKTHPRTKAATGNDLACRDDGVVARGHRFTVHRTGLGCRVDLLQHPGELFFSLLCQCELIAHGLHQDMFSFLRANCTKLTIVMTTTPRPMNPSWM